MVLVVLVLDVVDEDELETKSGIEVINSRRNSRRSGKSDVLSIDFRTHKGNSLLVELRSKAVHAVGTLGFDVSWSGELGWSGHEVLEHWDLLVVLALKQAELNNAVVEVWVGVKLVEGDKVGWDVVHTMLNGVVDLELDESGDVLLKTEDLWLEGGWNGEIVSSEVGDELVDLSNELWDLVVAHGEGLKVGADTLLGVVIVLEIVGVDDVRSEGGEWNVLISTLVGEFV